jgi:hypothetical protein
VVLTILTDEPTTVTRHGVSVEGFPTPPDVDVANSCWAMPPELAAADSGWRCAPTPGFLLIKLDHPGGMLQFRF